MPRAVDPKIEERLRGFSAAVFGSADLGDIHKLLREVDVPAPFRVRVKVLYSSGVPALERLRGQANWPWLKAIGPYGFGYDGDLLRPVSADGGGQSTSVPFAVLPTRQPNVSALVALCRREDWIDLMRFVKRLYPSLVPIHLSQRELLESVAELRRHVSQSFELRVRELSAKEVIESEGFARRERSVREWTYEHWEQLVGQVAERRQIVLAIAFEFYRKYQQAISAFPSAVCKVSKAGEVQVSSGLGLIWDTVVEDIALAGQRKLAFYSRRGLRENAYHPRPLSILFDAAVFADIDEVRRLVSVVTRYPRAMHSVQHGNPYAYVQVSDAYDGSSFDVWAVAEDCLTIVPRLKATEAAVDRLIHYLFEMFREGRVIEHATDAAGEQR